MARRRTKEQNRRYYQNRKAKAQREGWTGYSQKETARRRFQSEPELRLAWQRAYTDDLVQYGDAEGPEVRAGIGMFPSESPELFADWWQAFYDKKESQRRDRDSARAHWFVNVTGQVASFDDWEERYARGR